MPVTKAQAELLAPLIAACRPHGATHWDVPGILAALAQVRDRSLPEVIRAATRLAENRDARTPMALAGNGPQWRESSDQPIRFEPYDRAGTCGICGLTEPACRIRFAADHEFESVALAARNKGRDISGVVTELKDRRAKAEPAEIVPIRRDRGGTDPTADYQAARAATTTDPANMPGRSDFEETL
jgi:hypothetical protein